MTKKLKILIYKNQNWIPILNDVADLAVSKDLKSLVRSLIEKEVDLILFENNEIEDSKIDKIFMSYQIPFLRVLSEAKFQNKKDKYWILKSEESSLLEKVLNCQQELHQTQIARENKEHIFVLEGIKKFDEDVGHLGKDFFVGEVKNFFKSGFKAENTIWVDIPHSPSKLPPILRLKQELSQQKVDQSGLIADLDDCIQEIISEENYQVWRHKQGKYIALLWLHVESDKDQCVMINGLQFPSKKQLKSFFHYLLPVLKRRWSLCVEVGEAQEQVYKDSLTNLFNQKFLSETLDKKIEEYKRYKTPFSVLFIDVDFFKKVNDTMGHVVGSGVLKLLGTLLEKQIRSSDYAFRYGGDEFIILLSHTSGDDSVKVAERIRAKVESQLFSVNDHDVRITVSIGLAFYPDHAQSAEEIVRIADEAMYYGKKKSRNIVYKAS